MRTVELPKVEPSNLGCCSGASGAGRMVLLGYTEVSQHLRRENDKP